MDFGSVFPSLSAPSCVPHFHTVVPIQVQSMRGSDGSWRGTRDERNWGSHHLRATQQGFGRVGNTYDAGGWILENTAFTIQLKVRTNETLTQAQSLQPQKCSVTWTNDVLMQCFKTSKPMEKELTTVEMDGPS